MEKKNCPQHKIYIPDEIRVRYFPPNQQFETFDVLPLYNLKEYNERLTKEVSIPAYKEKWEKFKNGLPDSARRFERITFKSDKVPCFVNQVRKKLPKEYFEKQQKASSPGAIFYRSK